MSFPDLSCLGLGGKTYMCVYKAEPHHPSITYEFAVLIFLTGDNLRQDIK